MNDFPKLRPRARHHSSAWGTIPIKLQNRPKCNSQAAGEFWPYGVRGILSALVPGQFRRPPDTPVIGAAKHQHGPIGAKPKMSFDRENRIGDAQPGNLLPAGSVPKHEARLTSTSGNSDRGRPQTKRAGGGLPGEPPQSK